jgi:hypothetical protein
MSNKGSITGPTGLNARVVPDEQKPLQPPVEGQAVPTPPGSRFVSKNADYPDSTKRTFDIDVSKISAGVEAALNVHERQQARVNGDDTFEQRQLLTEIARRVKANEISNEHGRIWWETCFPGIDPSTVRGGQS